MEDIAPPPSRYASTLWIPCHWAWKRLLMAIIFCLNKSFFIHYTSNFENSSLTQEVIFELVARGNSKKKKNFDFLLSCFSLFIYTFFIVIVIFIHIDPFPSTLFLILVTLVVKFSLRVSSICPLQLTTTIS